MLLSSVIVMIGVSGVSSAELLEEYATEIHKRVEKLQWGNHAKKKSNEIGD